MNARDERSIGGGLVFYGGCAGVFVVSFVAAFLLPVSEFFKGLASIPSAAALIGFLAQLWRDRQAHERTVDLLHRQQDFALATASHMSNVAYDKHVAFCEEYIDSTNKGFAELMQQGPSPRWTPKTGQSWTRENRPVR